MLTALLLFAVFFIGFLVAPLAILVLFYIFFAWSDRSKRASGAEFAPAAEPDTGPEVARPAAPLLTNDGGAISEREQAAYDAGRYGDARFESELAQAVRDGGHLARVPVARSETPEELLARKSTGGRDRA